MDEWKARHQSEATPEQIARMEASVALATRECTRTRDPLWIAAFTAPAALAIACDGQPIPLITGALLTMAETTDDRLRLLIERVERLEEEKKGIADDIRDVYAEAKAVGYDAKIMRQIVRLQEDEARRPRRDGSDPRHLQSRARPGLKHRSGEQAERAALPAH